MSFPVPVLNPSTGFRLKGCLVSAPGSRSKRLFGHLGHAGNRGGTYQRVSSPRQARTADTSRSSDGPTTLVAANE